MSGLPEKVASGGFRVDRRKALEKLKEYGLPDPARFLLPWLRCAQASGATRAELSHGWGSLELAFNGRPLSPKFLAEPFDALFSDEEDALRHRDLATGLLTAFRLAPDRVSIASGAAAARLELSGRTAEDVAAAPSPSGDFRTIMSVGWTAMRIAHPAVCAAAAAQACRMLPFPLFVNGAEVPREPLDPLVTIDADGTRVRVSLPEDPGLRETTATLYKRGVAVGSSFLDTRVVVVVEADRDDFTLDASQTNVIQDDRLSQALAAVPAGIEALLQKCCALQREYPKLAAFLFEPAGEPLRRRLAKRSLASRFLDAAQEAAGVEGAATLDVCLDFERRVTAWLRTAAARNLTAEALWEAPLYLSVGGKGLSLRDLREQYRADGLVPVARTIAPAPENLKIVWLPNGPDGALEALFPHGVREMDELLAGWSKIRQMPPPFVP